ncbi:hypothetical protein EVAR_18812_1 [Eumeta japonica]|uniref:Uncharacterized protein n=1 Tax=Eumeta variegata TaxID=151549 RepID=A0A4C1ULZ3_EUMVA|nr:hypothetical protein EVAR_18812_1 [Eumeta japonica]
MTVETLASSAASLPAPADTNITGPNRATSSAARSGESTSERLARFRKTFREGNSATRKVAFQSLSVVSQTTFIFALCIIDKYNTILQRVANILQSKTLDILRCAEHIQTITTAVAEHRRPAEEGSEDLIKSAEEIATALNIERRLPRTASRQQHRANQPAASFSEYFCRSLYVPYLDSLSSSLEVKFSKQHSPAFTLSLLHPTQIIKITVPILQKCMEEVSDFYELEGFTFEADLWRTFWINKQQLDFESIGIVDLIQEADPFYFLPEEPPQQPNKLNSRGEAMRPCLTSLRLSKQSVFTPFILTQALEPLHRDCSVRINPLLILCIYDIENHRSFLFNDQRCVSGLLGRNRISDREGTELMKEKKGDGEGMG